MATGGQTELMAMQCGDCLQGMILIGCKNPATGIGGKRCQDTECLGTDLLSVATSDTTTVSQH